MGLVSIDCKDNLYHSTLRSNDELYTYTRMWRYWSKVDFESKTKTKILTIILSFIFSITYCVLIFFFVSGDLFWVADGRGNHTCWRYGKNSTMNNFTTCLFFDWYTWYSANLKKRPKLTTVTEQFGHLPLLVNLRFYWKILGFTTVKRSSFYSSIYVTK